ncbi:MAG: type II CRISPR RNA-guided endonuclease Cas9, partial [Soonwooa sp.]
MMTKNILGLDLGIASIGWALITVDENYKPIKIVGMGSRIIPLSTEDKTQFERGQSITKNQERTKSRTQRKGYDRKQLKNSDDFKYSLKLELEKFGIFPNDELINLPTLDLWKLRSNAVSEEINPQQLGRILYMLNQKRGYKSARSEANADKKDTDYVAEVKGRYALLKDSNLTIGQHFYNELSFANSNNSYYRVKEQVYPREAYIEEFDTIINTQKQHHSFLTDEVINRLRNEIIYYQRKLKSQKGLVSVCEFEGFEKTIIDEKLNKEKTIFVGPKVAPKTSPIFQLCKIWEVVNNITLKIKNPEGSKYKWSDYYPTTEEKKQIAEHLSTSITLTYADLLKILNLKKDQVFANKQIQKGIQGNVTYHEIHKVLGDSDWLGFKVSVIESNDEAILIDKKTGEILEERQKLIIENTFEQEPLYQLWHTIYSVKDLDECKNALMKRFSFGEELADKLSRIDFNKQAFGNKSAKAIRKILPYLMQGFDYSQASSLAGYNHSNSLTKAENEEREVKEKLELLAKNSLRQPVVEKIINQMINVVNAIIKVYGKPDEIRLELARELKQSKDERDSADKSNSNNKKQNEMIAKRLESMGIPATKKYIQKYKFIFPAKDKKWKEADVVNQCIYCGQHFNLSEALIGNNFDVDHIVPKALLFDDSQTNKVLVHRHCNSKKLDRTAYDYIATKGEKELNEYLQRVDDWFVRGVLSYGKMQRLKVSFVEYLERKQLKKETEADKKLWESFIDRQLRESQYIAKKSRGILQQICKNVTVTEGTITAKLRKIWGWDDVLMNLQISKYKMFGQTQMKEWTSDHGKRTHEKEEIINWTKRDDHRHHAVDALVIACTKQGYIQRINTLNASDVRNDMLKKVEESKIQYNEKLNLLEKYLLTEKPFSTSEVEKEADKILISFKSGKKVATISKFKAKGKNKEVGVIVPRGALHEQSVYGKIKIEERDKPLKYLFEKSDSIVNPIIKMLIKERLSKNENDPKKALASTKKEPIYLDEQQGKVLEKAICYKDATVMKYDLTAISSKQVGDIVDKKIRDLVRERLQQFGNKEKEAFKDVLWFNEEKQIPIKTVRLFARPDANGLQSIKKDAKGNDIGFVVQGNNHHIAIYKNEEGKQIQHYCTFWHAVERKKFGIPTLIKNTTDLWNAIGEKVLPQSFLQFLPEDNLTLDFSMQQNEMFILGLSDDEFNDAVRNNDKSILSKHLYLVWSISNNDFWFRHHLETKNTELKKTDGAKESKRFYRLSLKGLNDLYPKKVKINQLGQII